MFLFLCIITIITAITHKTFEMDNHTGPADEELGLLSTVGSAPSEETTQGEGGAGIRQHQEAQAAFWANAELVAVATPRQSIWTGGNPLARYGDDNNDDEHDEIDPGASFHATQNNTPGSNVIDNPPSQGGENPGVQQDDDDDDDWQPSLSVGSIDTTRLSSREAARRYMLQWDHIWEYNRKHHPGSLAVVERHRAEARREYEAICARNHADDRVAPYQRRAFQQGRIAARVAVLRQALAEAEAGPDAAGTAPMRRNMAAALDGYASGALGYSGTYALIYAGRIVDTSCTSYAEFTAERAARLDGYFAQYGPGYLWWEPPLANTTGGGGDRVSAKKGTMLGLQREHDVLYYRRNGGNPFRDDACHFQISLGFRKANSLRCRRAAQAGSRRTATTTTTTRPKRKWEFIPDDDVDSSQKQQQQQPPRDKKKRTAGPNGKFVKTSTQQQETAAAAAGEPAEGKRAKILPAPPARRKTTTAAAAAAAEKPAPPPSQPEEEDEDAAGPTIFLEMLLDSGAEFPILLHRDFELLGYTAADMNAATVVELNAAAGQNSVAQCFELLVGLDLRRGGGDRTKHDDDSRHFFPTRVVKLGPAIRGPASGGYSGERLSGILPFLAYYVSGAPGQDALWLGGERGDVLGADKVPAGVRYDPFFATTVAATEGGQGGGATAPGRLRRVLFEHDLVPEQVPGGRNNNKKKKLLVDRELVVEEEAAEEAQQAAATGTRNKVTLHVVEEANRKVTASWEVEPARRGPGRWRRVEYR